MKRLATPLCIALALAACGSNNPDTASTPAAPAKVEADQPAAPPPPQTAEQAFAVKYAEVLAGAWRSEANRARDGARHPRQTLEFFGLKPSMSVIEITPGKGWYTEILAPLLRDQGHLVAAVIEPASASSEKTTKYLEKANAGFRELMAGNAEQFGSVEVREFSQSAPKFGEPGSADMVLTFRNVHNFMMWNSDAAVFSGFFAVLKPGGVLGVTDHRAAAGSDLAKIKESGYIPEDYVIKLATDAGFVLDARSDINANPADTKDYEGGVWTLPPTLGQGDKDKDKYLAIGESDRMTLRFVKPAATADKVFDSAEPAKTPKP